MAAAIAESGAGSVAPANTGMQEVGKNFATAINCSVTDVVQPKSSSYTGCG
jgi:hypothetical protein